MNGNYRTSWDRDVGLDKVAAELTSAAYALTLPHVMKGSWVGLELGLWKALVETFEGWDRARPRAASSEQFESRKEGLLAELTERACCVAVEHGVEGPLPELKTSLYQAFQSRIKYDGRQDATTPGGWLRDHS
jgi:hypothetical protein